jgi:endoglucanase
MYKGLKLILLGAFIISVIQLSAQNPFTKGVNLTGWFAAPNARSIAFTKFTKKDFQNIKSLGCDVVRLPIELHSMTSGAPDYIVDTLFYFYLDQVIDWTEELQMNLIIDNHTIPDAKSKTVEIPLMKIWPQMANHYKGRSNLIFYEILNEPNTLLASDWAKIQQNVVDTIRTIDAKHTLIVTGADWGGIPGLMALKKLSDPNLIYSFHFYDPFLFTHQGASWADLTDLGGVPFPYDATRMPACPESLKNTWVAGSLSSGYKTDGTVAKLKSTIDGVIKYGTTNGVKVYCGEMGVYNLKSLDADRVYWYKEVASYLTSKMVPWTMWDYQGGFGIFNKGSNEVFEYDINRAQAEGMGFTPPPVKQYVMRADTVPFDIYTDLPGEGIIQGGSGDLFSSNVHEGNYSILLTELARYSNLEFKFKLAKDLSKLVNANYTVDFWVKADSPGSNVVLRFIDTKTNDPKDHPWRMDYTVNSSVAPFDGEWHLVQIPLKKFVDAGSYENDTWYGSTKSFDWKAVDRFQIVTENMALTGKKFWFDNIRINGTPITGITENPKMNQFKAKAFPNPLTSETVIEYTLPVSANVDVSIFDLTGRKLHTLVNARETKGIHQVLWTPCETNSPDKKQGIYFCRISSAGKNEVIKLLVNK